jgi:hypothetical protein
MFFENFTEESKSIQSMKMGDYQAHLGLIFSFNRIFVLCFLNGGDIQKRIGWQETVRC